MKSEMKAGFARVCITPPPGTRMMGLGDRDAFHGCDSVHDDIFVRALYCEHGNEAALIMSFDCCFIGREDSGRFKDAVGRALDLRPRQILFSATHSHAGPASGTWYSAGFLAPDRLYLQCLERAVVQAAIAAQANAQEATLHAGAARSSLPQSRRLCVDGQARTAPNPDGLVSDVLPVCLLQNAQAEPICLLFSVATHPSIVRGAAISAEFPGVACDLLDAHLGAPASLFLQGTGGDSKPANIAAGDDWNWQAGWEEMEEAGRIVAQETISCLQAGLAPVEPRVRTALLEMQWPLQAVRREYLEAVRENPEQINDPIIGAQWAARQLEQWDKYGAVASSAAVLLQGVQLGEGLRLIAMEGEPVAFYGRMMQDAYADGVTFPLGYANGEALYLVTSAMVDEGGMEVVSYYQFGCPAPLAAGMEPIVAQALEDLRRRGVG